MKYMVMECHPSYAVVLDEQGNFLKVANLHYEVGQTVTEVITMQVTPQKRPTKWLYSLAAMAACLVLLITTLFTNPHQPYASVYVKINPEVRIDVDKQDVVIGLTGVNQDGIDLIQGYTYENKQLEQVADELVDRAIDMGYLHEEGKITISLDSLDQLWVEDHTNLISDQLQTHLQEKIVVNIEIKLCNHEHPGKDHREYDYEEDTSEAGDLLMDTQNPNRIEIDIQDETEQHNTHAHHDDCDDCDDCDDDDHDDHDDGDHDDDHDDDRDKNDHDNDDDDDDDHDDDDHDDDDRDNDDHDDDDHDDDDDDRDDDDDDDDDRDDDDRDDDDD